MIQRIQQYMGNTVGSRQKDIIIGTLLGDGFLERDGNHTRLIIDHSDTQRAYLEWKFQQLKSLGGKVIYKKRFDTRTKRFYYHCIFRSRTSSLFEEYFILFYKQKRKIVPRQLSDIINSQILAIWLMDDGYCRNDCNALRINTQSYSYEEHVIIQQALQTLGIDSNIHRQKQYWVTYIPSKAMNRVRTLVSDLIIPEMAYKIV